MFKVVGRLLHLILVVHIAIAHGVGPFQVVDVVYALQIHGQTFQSVGDFSSDGATVNTSHLLEVGELRHLHTVKPHLPTQAPSAEGGVFPIVFYKTNVVGFKVKAQCL